MRCVLLLVLALASSPVSAQQRAPDADAPARVIRGVVVAPNDAALPRTRVTARIPATNGVVRSVMTGHDGRFELAVPDAPDLRVTIVKAGYAAQTFTLSRSDLDRTLPRELRVTLVRGAAITGRVADSRGEPSVPTRIVARADATSPETAPAEFESESDDRGEYRIGGLPPGRYTVIAHPPARGSQGAATATATAAPASATITLFPGDEIGNVDFTIEVPPATAPANPPAGPEDSGVIRGRITSAAGSPMGGVLVRAVRSGAGIRSAMTGADGQYRIDGLSPGDYLVEASGAGHFTRQYGQTGLVPDGRPVGARNDRVTERIDITLPRPSAIAGTVVDEYGEPLQDVAVDVLQIRQVAGRPRALRGQGRRTDDQGRYRVYGLLAGTYIVRVEVNDPLVGSDAQGYAPVYYPGSGRIEDATQVRVSLGLEALNTDVVVRPTPAVRVTGTVRDPSGRPIAAGLLLVISERSGAIQIEPTPAKAAADGSFEFVNVPPGDYVLQALGPPAMGADGRPASGPAFTAHYVTVADSSPPPISLKMTYGATVTGRIRIDGQDSVPSSGFALLAAPSDFDRAPIVGFGSQGFSVESNGDFRYAGLTGMRRLIINSAPPGWYLESVVIKGEELADRPFDFGLDETTIGDVEILVSPSGAGVSAYVTDDRGAPVVDGTVIVFSTDPAMWFPRSRWVKIGRTPSDGVYRITGLPPGEYWVAAVTGVDAAPGGGEWQDPELLRMVSGQALRLAVGNGEMRELTLRAMRP